MPHPLAPSHIARSSTQVGAVAADAEDRKRQKFLFLSGRTGFYLFEFEVETCRAVGPSARRLIKSLAQRFRDCGLKLSRTHILYAILAVVLEGNAS